MQGLLIQYLPDRNRETLFSFFARYEGIYDDDTSPIPYYEIGGVEVDQMTFDAELEERITSQIPERSAWTAIP